ncbi:hypothetical protein [Streptomyces sp. NPDC016675]|uniref:hypothetical protein n=1 Tax=Streptomyces sp. NPDC016675 TaxID=3364970 RepID=UPI0036F5AA2D
MIRSSARHAPPEFTERAGTGDPAVDPYAEHTAEDRADLARGTTPGAQRVLGHGLVDHVAPDLDATLPTPGAR